jgi:hypothetical protein
MCGVNVNYEAIVAQIVVAALNNEKFFENMTADEKIQAVHKLYKTMHHEIVEHAEEHIHEHTHA